jgi:hypothetical protein
VQLKPIFGGSLTLLETDLMGSQTGLINVRGILGCSTYSPEIAPRPTEALVYEIKMKVNRNHAARETNLNSN